MLKAFLWVLLCLSRLCFLLTMTTYEINWQMNMLKDTQSITPKTLTNMAGGIELLEVGLGGAAR